MKSFLRILAGIIFLGLLLITSFSLYSYIMLQKTFPKYNGELISNNVKNSVLISFDKNAFPTIEAQNDQDVAYSLGYLHATERMFQIDIMRRAALGQLSELFGEKTVEFDIMFKTLGLKDAAIRSYNSLPEHYKSILISYSNGINDYIKNNSSNLDMEFSFLGGKPLIWKPYHSILISKLMAWELNLSWWSDISFTNLVHKFGETKVREILPDYPENGPTTVNSNSQIASSEISSNIINVDKALRDLIGFKGNHLGSNNWVVSPLKSASNKPIMANDPHLVLTNPSSWYFVNIKSPEWNSAGFTIPGVPVVVIGNNNKISWSVTNLMSDDCDFYSENIDTKSNKYYCNNVWQPLAVVDDTIKVSGQKDLIIHKKYTHRGPLISDFDSYSAILGSETKRKHSNLSVSWVGFQSSQEFKNLLDINKSNNYNEFQSALKDYATPGQNYIYSDIEGNIGYVCAAKIPIRPNNSTSFAYDGTTTANDWKGFVPYDQMPKMYNPVQGFIATANNKVDRSFQYHISNIWEPTSRIERITEILNSKQTHNSSDFKGYQNDQTSVYAREMVPYIINAFQNVQVKDKNLKIALEVLKVWDGNMSKELQAPAIYSVFFKYLLENTFKDEMGDRLFREYVFLANVPYRVIQTMCKNNNSTWFDNVKTQGIETRDIIIRKSLVDALNELENEFGKEFAFWQWGKLHKLTVKHLFAGQSSILDFVFNTRTYEVGGDGTTLYNTEYFFGENFDCKVGPSMRYIYDFAKPDEIIMNMPTGQSGHVFSEHYTDLTENFMKGGYIIFNKKNPQNVNSLRISNR